MFSQFFENSTLPKGKLDAFSDVIEYAASTRLPKTGLGRKKKFRLPKVTTLSHFGPQIVNVRSYISKSTERTYYL